MRFDTLVLGAGIVGVSVAVHLQKRGRAVALVDRRAPGFETSFGNAGLIQREGVYPYAFPRDLSTAKILTAFGAKGVPGIGLPWPVVAALVIILGFILLLRRTSWGRLTVATGSNETAVRLAGLPVARYKFLAYTICGGLSALAGIMVTARTAVGTPVTGIGLELDAIAACVIGGALLSGGKGTVIQTMIGVLILGLIGNIMNLMSVPAYPQQIIKGVIIILAVLLQGVGARATRRV